MAISGKNIDWHAVGIGTKLDRTVAAEVGVHRWGAAYRERFMRQIPSYRSSRHAT